MKLFKFSPLTEKRLLRFRNSHVAFWSLRLLIVLYVISLFSELICNNKPLYLNFDGETSFPFLNSHVSDNVLAATGSLQVDYREFVKSEKFTKNPSNKVIFAPIPYGPGEVLDTADLEKDKEVSILLTPVQPVARFNLTSDGAIIREESCLQFFPNVDLRDGRTKLASLISLSPELNAEIAKRLRGNAAEKFECEITPNVLKNFTWQRLNLSLPAQAESEPRNNIRVNIASASGFLPEKIYTFKRTGEGDKVRFVEDSLLPDTDELMVKLIAWAKEGFLRNITARDAISFIDAKVGTVYMVTSVNNIRFPFPPTRTHLFGLDGSGRDVLARILYGMRIAVSFGLVLAIWATLIGMTVGSLQGYFGGKFDICMQRVTEIWVSLPFLYIMVLVGAVFGRNFWLLLLCYGLFSWIGTSLYMRGEFLRLRNRPFVDAARCQGFGNARIIFRHILPNAITPLVTLFPFCLVGAISALVSLDFLGFGLPPLTPSWGELLQQAQTYRWAWWLILFPAGALFCVMFLTVMIGEGVRNAFDPKPYSKME